MTQAFVALGSNLQDPASQVRTALIELAELPQTRLVRQSPLYRSDPMGPPDQPDYINAVAELDTELTAVELLQELQNLEHAHGRVRDGERWGPRILDLDLLLYGDAQINTETLTVPHPGIAQRVFVLYPLQDIAPNLRIPGIGTLRELIRRIPTAGLIRVGEP
jgi:2-amino-4-hydroxy-6-hydroxymethyldihydropteridine diphosphokinase